MTAESANIAAFAALVFLLDSLRSEGKSMSTFAMWNSRVKIDTDNSYASWMPTKNSRSTDFMAFFNCYETMERCSINGVNRTIGIAH